MLVIFKMTNLPKHSLPVRVAEDDKPDTTTFHLSEDGVPMINDILVNEEKGRNVATPNLAAGRNGGQEAGRNNADKTTTIANQSNNSLFYGCNGSASQYFIRVQENASAAIE